MEAAPLYSRGVPEKTGTRVALSPVECRLPIRRGVITDGKC
jgi:hypothetical protein